MKRYWDDLELGHKIVFLDSNPITRVHIAQFAAICDDFSPLYLDDEFAKSVGFASAFVPNLLALSIHGLLTQHYQQHDEFRIRLNLWCNNQHNDVVLKAQALCLLFKNQEHEKKSKSSLPLISSKSHDELKEKWEETIKAPLENNKNIST